jgi:hypothetical protein
MMRRSGLSVILTVSDRNPFNFANNYSDRMDQDTFPVSREAEPDEAAKGRSPLMLLMDGFYADLNRPDDSSLLQRDLHKSAKIFF